MAELGMEIKRAIVASVHNGEADVYAWRDNEGNVVDTMVTWSGEQCASGGMAESLSKDLGRQVEFAGKLTTSEDVEKAIMRGQ